ncbi:hypothetical protein ACLEXA_17805 [Pseudescherichia vulneris]
MPPVNPPIPTSSNQISWVSRDSSNPEDQDIWFDAIDHVEMEDTWFEGAEAFDTHEEHQADPSSSAGLVADSRVPFTEDCRRGVQQLVRTLGEYGESRMLSACLSKILPGTPTSLIIAANSLYTAVTERRNIDTAALHALGLASGYLPDNINIVSRLATFIRDTVTGWTDETFLQQFLGNEENHTSIHLFTALAITAIVAGRWMKDEGTPQRGVLKVPAFIANIFIRAGHYWTALGNMAGSPPSGTAQPATAFEVDTQVEMSRDVYDASTPCSSAPRLTAFSSNSTARPEAYTRATVQNRPAPAPGKITRLSVPEQAHSLAVEKLRQESGLSDLLYCTNLKTETRQQTNEKIITNTYFNTKCDATVYPEPLREAAESIPVQADRPETQVSSAATSRSVGEPLLPIVMTAATVATTSPYLQALKSKTVIIPAAVLLGVAGAGVGGMKIWGNFPTGNQEGNNVNRNDHINTSPLKAKKENNKIIKLLVREGLLKKGKVNKERLLCSVAEYLFGNKNGIAGSADKLQVLARHILSADGLYGGERNEQLLTTQVESVVRRWVFNNILGMSPVDYILDKRAADTYPEYYTVSSIDYVLSMQQLIKDNHLRYKDIPSSQWGNLNAMWNLFLIEEMPFLKIKHNPLKDIEIRSFDFANLYSGSKFLEMTSVKSYTSEDAIKVGEKIWDSAINEGINIYNLEYYRVPALLFMSEKGKPERNDIDVLNHYLEKRKYFRELKNDVAEKYDNYISATKRWLSEGRLADKIIAECTVLPPARPDIGDAIRTPEDKRARAQEQAKQWYLLGAGKPCETAPESLVDVYKNQTMEVADSFMEIDRYIILASILDITKEESDFIFSPDAVIHPVHVNMKTRKTPWSGLGGANHDNDIIASLYRTDVFSVILDGEERIYALKGESNIGGYKFIRVDRDIKKLIDNNVFDYKFPSGYEVDNSTLHVSTNSEKFHYSYFIDKKNSVVVKDNMSLVDSLSKKHRDALYDALYKTGDNKADIEKVWENVKNIIPFYDCVEGIIKKDPDQAVPACIMDAVSFIPFFIQAARLTGRFGLSLVRGLRSGALTVGKEGINIAGINVIREVSLPTTAETLSLGKNFLRALDPGFEQMKGLSRSFHNKIVKILSADKQTALLAKSISSSGLPLQPLGKMDTGISAYAQLPVPVKAILRNAGRNIYVQINPETGGLFGNKFVKDGSGNLVPYTTIKRKLNYQENKVTGITVGNLVQFQKSNELNFKLHETGLYSPLDFHGEKTGELFLRVKDTWIPVTEITEGKYYMIQEKDGWKILEKKHQPGKFDFVDNKIKDKYVDSTWCPSQAVGRKLLMNPENTCIGTPTLEYEDVTYRVNLPLSDVNHSHDFNVRYRGLYGMDTTTRLEVKNRIDDTLFYESRMVNLKQEPIDASAYENVFSDKDINISDNELMFSDSSDAGLNFSPILTKNEKIAVRRWTAVDDDLNDFFSDGMKDTSAMGIEPLNYDLNKSLANGEVLNEDERNMVRLYDSALNKIPSQKGEFIRISEYNDLITPWDNEIKPGDIVTNFPCYMSVSADTRYIENYDAHEKVRANVFFRFENTYSAKPLLRGSASLIQEELESVFRRNSAFKVKQIAIADEVTRGAHALDTKKRIVVTLEEVDLPLSKIAKNIHTGKYVNVDV